MRRALRASIVAAACAGGLVLSAVGASCTTFNGLTVPPPASDGGLDTMMTSEGAVDAPAEAAPQPRGLLSVQDAARVCALVAKCPYLSPSLQQSNAVPADPSNFSLCMHWLAGPFPPDRLGFGLQQQVLTCVAQATTCEQAGSCVSFESLNPTDPRCADAGADAGERCIDNGATVLSCASLTAAHCNSPYYATGSTCTKGAAGLYGCALGPNCTLAPTCIGASVFDECGSQDLLHYQLHCDYGGYDCSETADASIVGCLTGNQDLLCGTIETNCSADGKSVQVCDGYNYSLYDCASLSGTCSSKSGSAVCVTPADKCTPFDSTVNTCQGSVLSLCIGGRSQSLDCSTIGMTCMGIAGSGHCG